MSINKILIFNWRCWLNPEMGGAEIFTHEIAKRWVKDGIKVTLFTSEFPNCNLDEAVDGVRIVRSGGKYSVYRKAKKYYKNYFSKENYDIIIDEINTRPFLTPEFVNKGEKIFALIHQLAREYWFYETPFPINYIGYYFLEKNWLKKYFEVPTLTVSESTEEDLLKLGFRKVFVVTEGLNFDPLVKIPEKEGYPVIVYSGRLKRAKRPDHAIKAFRIIKEWVPKAELWIIGDGPLKNKLQKTSGKGVRFFGTLNNFERREKIKRSWVLINPSVREGWGLNVIEANALGVPALAYDVNGLRDSVKNGKTGLLAEAGNIEDLACKTSEVLNKAALRKKLAEQALKYSNEFSWNRTAEDFMNVLDMVIDE